jgi:hypothetical protein
MKSGALHAAKKKLREMQHERDRERGRKVGRCVFSVSVASICSLKI